MAIHIHMPVHMSAFIAGKNTSGRKGAETDKQANRTCNVCACVCVYTYIYIRTYGEITYIHLIYTPRYEGLPWALCCDSEASRPRQPGQRERAAGQGVSDAESGWPKSA